MHRENELDSSAGIEKEEYPPLLINRTRGQGSASGPGISPDDILNFIGFGPFQVIAFLLSGLTYFAYGSDVSIFLYLEENLVEEWNVTSSQYAILPAMTVPPNVVGAVIFSFLSDRFGRWWPYALCVGWMGTFSIASAFANSFPLMIGLRCCASLAIGGIAGFTFPTVIEFLPVKSRGSVSVLNMLMDALGVSLSCGLAWWLIPAYPGDGWRYYIIATALPTFGVALFRLCLYVESPRFLIANGKLERAWKVFNIIAKVNRRKLTDFISHDTFKRALALTTLGGSEGNQKQPSILVQLSKIFYPSHLRLTLPLSMIMITQSFGFLSSSLFLADFLKGVNTSKYFTIFVIQLARIPGSLLLSIIVEWPKVGRLNSLRLFSSLGIIFFLLLTFIQNTIAIPLLLIFIYFSISPIRGLLYTYISEAYPTSIRSVTVSYFYILEALTYMCGSFAGSKAANVSQHWVFPAVFTAVYFVQLCISFLLTYETGGKNLKDTVK